MVIFLTIQWYRQKQSIVVDLILVRKTQGGYNLGGREVIEVTTKGRLRALIAVAAVVAASALTVTGCPAPFGPEVVERVTDNDPPSLEVTSPEDGSTYVETVVVEGVVADGDEPPADRVTVTYTVEGALGVLVEDTVTAIDVDGSFEFSFDTISFSGPVSLTVTATDWNQNATRVTIALEAPPFALPSFTAIASNETVQVSWAPVPGATGYTLRYTDNGSLPTDTYGTAVPFVDARTTDDPYVISDAMNGRLYVLRLEVTVPSGTLTSGYVSVVPLSQFTLAPRVRGGYQRIDLEWPPIPATNQFEVWRSESRDGTYIDYSGTVTGTTYSDLGVTANQVYYYKIRPIIPGAVLSGANSGIAHPFPDTEQARRSEELLAGAPDRVAISGEIAVVAAGTDGVHIVDISDPDNPEYLTTYTRTDIDAVDVAALDSYAYVSDAQTDASSTDGAVLAIDISTPGTPVLADSVPIDEPEAIDVTDDYVYVVDSGATVRLILIENPTAMVISAQSYTPPLGGASEIAAIDYTPNLDYDLLFVIDPTDDPPYYSRVHCVLNYDRDYADDPSPTLYDTYQSDSLLLSHVAVTPTNVYLWSMVPFAIEDFYYYVEVLDFPGMNQVGITADDYIIGWSAQSDITVYGNRVFASNGIGIRMFNVADETNPVSIDYWDTPGPAQGLAIGDRHIYAASGNLGLQGVDLTAPGNFEITASYDVIGANDVAIDGTIAYLAAADATLTTVNIAGNGALPLLDSIDVGASSASVALSGDYAVVATGSTGITVVNIADPSDLEVAGTGYQTSYTTDVSIYGDYAYVVSGTGLQVWKISDPSNPEFVGFHDSLNAARRVDVHGNIAYMTESGYYDPAVLHLVDISDPETPIAIESLGVAMQPYDIVVRDGYAFLSDNYPSGGTGLYVVDVDSTRPTFGTVVGNVATDGIDEAIDAITNYVFLGSNDPTWALKLISTNDIASLDETAIIDGIGWTDADPVEVLQWNEKLFIADANNGLLVIDALLE
jgi:hypothetical protein